VCDDSTHGPWRSVALHSGGPVTSSAPRRPQPAQSLPPGSSGARPAARLKAVSIWSGSGCCGPAPHRSLLQGRTPRRFESRPDSGVPPAKPEFPHAVRYSIDCLQTALDRIHGEGGKSRAAPLTRLAGKLQASLALGRSRDPVGGRCSYLEGILYHAANPRDDLPSFTSITRSRRLSR